MGRHFKKKPGLEKILTLLLMSLLVASVAFLAGSFIVRDNEAGKPREAVTAETTEPDYDGVSDEIPGEPGGTKETSTPIAVSEPRITLTDGEKPLLAIIVDDGGHQIDLAKRVAAADLPMTWAIIPYTRFMSETARLAESKGIPYLVHMPMQAKSDKDGNGEYLIGRGFTREHIQEVTRKALNSMPGAIGLNNHRGSLATSVVEIMEPVIYELKERGLIFVDSRTSQESVAYNVAIINGVPALRNRGFLDGSQEKAEIEKRFNEAVQLAVKRGDTIVICHFRPTTVKFLEALAARKGTLPVRLVTVPEMREIIKTRGH